MIAAFGDCLAPGGKEELRANCLNWFWRENGLRTEQEVCAFAREILLFSSTSGKGAEATVDLRPGRGANRQRQSEVFLPTLSLTTKSTVNSPKANTIPEAPAIIVTPGAMTRDDSFAGLDRTDWAAGDNVCDEWDDIQEDDQDTQLQKSRETRWTIESRPVEALASPALEGCKSAQKTSKREANFFVFPACSQAERILTALPATPTGQLKPPRDGCLVQGSTSTNAVLSFPVSVKAATETNADASMISCARPIAEATSSGDSNPSLRNKRGSMR